MAVAKYLFVYRSPVGGDQTPPSPAEMQQMLAQWAAWKERFRQEILDVGDGLKPGGCTVRPGAVTDGPFVEAKEVLGGYSIVEAASVERATEIARACPVLFAPGSSVEVREMAGF